MWYALWTRVINNPLSSNLISSESPSLRHSIPLLSYCRAGPVVRREFSERETNVQLVSVRSVSAGGQKIETKETVVQSEHFDVSSLATTSRENRRKLSFLGTSRSYQESSPLGSSEIISRFFRASKFPLSMSQLGPCYWKFLQTQFERPCVSKII